MAIKETYEIKTSNNDKYIIRGQSGIFKQNELNYKKGFFLKSKRFILIDLWQVGIFGSENCNQIYDNKKKINITTEKDIIDFTNDTIEYINEGLFNEIKQTIIDEIEADEEETIKLTR